MPREIPKDHPSLDLKKSLEFVFSNLEKGVTERGHHFHLLVLGTIDKDNKPQNRNVVLRKVDMVNSIIRFHTDIRSNKIIDIKNNSSISLLGYDKANKLQIRLTANAVIEESKEVLSDVWTKMYPMSRECYRVSRSPGDRIDSLSEVEFDEDKENNLIGFDNFTAIQCHIKTIEVLYLSHIAHIRAKYNNINGILKGEWIIP